MINKNNNHQQIHQLLHNEYAHISDIRQQIKQLRASSPLEEQHNQLLEELLALEQTLKKHWQWGEAFEERHD